MNSTTRTIALAIVATGLAGAPAVFAQNETDKAPQAEAPAMKPNDIQDMMQGGDMMGMMKMMTQMSEMMGACTKMMQAMTPDGAKPNEGGEQGNPG